MSNAFTLPNISIRALAVWRRNARVWVRLLGPSLVLHFGEPLLWLLGLGLGLGMYVQGVSEGSYLTFLISGMIASTSMMSTSYESTFSAYTRMVPQQTYSAMLNTPLTVDDIILGEIFWGATKGMIAASALFIVGAGLGAMHGPVSVLALLAVFVSGLCFAAFGMAITALAKGYEHFNYYLSLIITPMLVISGVFYPIERLPEALQWVVKTLPLYHAIGITRPLVSGAPLQDFAWHALVLLMYLVVGVLLAVHLARKRLLT
jgi:lipooligosaccharide transport system permease protein